VIIRERKRTMGVNDLYFLKGKFAGKIVREKFVREKFVRGKFVRGKLTYWI
jgi:hypothetical protein